VIDTTVDLTPQLDPKYSHPLLTNVKLHCSISI